MTSALLVTEATAQHSSDALIALLTATHAALAPPWRACNDSQDVISRGSVYYARNFAFTEPSDEAGVEPSVSLETDNVDRELFLALRGLNSRPTLKVELVFATQPDVVVRSYPRLFVSGFSADAMRLDVQLAFRSLRAEPFPFVRFDGRFKTLYQ